MKKVLSVVLCFALILCAASPALADGGCNCGFSPVIYVGPLGCSSIVRDAGTENEQQLWKIDTKFLLSNLGGVLPDVTKALLTRDTDLLGDALVRFVNACFGDLAPACVYGTKEGYDESTLWTGPQSWSGKDWEYRTLEDMVKEASGDENKQVLVMGLTNDAIGYNLPDTITTKGILTPLLIYNGDGGNEVSNSILMTVSCHSASDIVKGFGKLLEVEAKS